MKRPSAQTIATLAAALAGGVAMSFAYDSSAAERSLALIAPIPLLILARLRAPRAAALAGFVFGTALFATSLSWFMPLVDNNGPLALVIAGQFGLGAYCALYVALFAYAYSAFNGKWRSLHAAAAAAHARLVDADEGSAEEDAAAAEFAALRRRIAVREALSPLAAAALWAGAEWLRGWIGGGFPWYSAGVAFADNPILAQLAAFGGVQLVSAAVIVFSDALSGTLLRTWRTLRRAAPASRRHFDLSLAIFLAMIVFVSGTHRIRALREEWNPESNGSIRIQTVSHDQPCLFENDPDEWERAYDRLLGCSTNSPVAGIDAVLWPETSLWRNIPDPILEAEMVILSKRCNAPILAGSCADAGIDQVMNVVAHYSANGLENIYVKRHLIPFGEYFPLDDHLEWLRRFSPSGISCKAGERPVSFNVGGKAKLSPLICFEDTFARAARDSARDADVLVSHSNDSWFCGSDEYRQHHAEALLRAVENNIPFVRVSNFGMRAVVLPDGSVPVWQDAPGTFIHDVPVNRDRRRTVYSRLGDFAFAVPCSLFLLAVIAFSRFSRNRRIK